MKKLMNIFVLVAAAAMALASCQKPEIENPEPQSYEYTFLIGDADASDDADSKAVIGSNCIEWESGDQMGVYTKVAEGTISGNAYGDITPGSPATMKVYSTQALAIGDYIYAYYPYSSANKDQNLSVTLEIPAEQDGKDDMPMVAIPHRVESALNSGKQDAPAGKIKFANLGSVIEFNVYSTTEEYQSELVKSVAFHSDQPVAGNFVFDLTAVDYSDEATLSISGYEEKSIVTTLASAGQVPASKDAALVVKMVVAPGSYTGNVVVTTDKATYTYPIATAKEFKRSAIKPLGLNLREESRVASVLQNHTIEWESAADWTESSTKLISGDYTVQTARNGGSTNPTVNTTSNDCRVYADGTVTVSNSSGNIKKLVFNLSTQGKKRLSDISASSGVVTIDSENWVVVWEGNAPSVTFTVGAKADYGTDGSSKAGQLCFTSIDAVAEVSSEPSEVTLTGLEVSGMTTEFVAGSEFVFDGKAYAVYSDDERKDVTESVTAELSDADMSVIGTKKVTVAYEEDGNVVTAEYDITVSDNITDYSGTYAIVAYRSSESVYYYLTNEETTSSTKKLVAVAAGTEKPADGIVVSASKLWAVEKSGNVYKLKSAGSEEYVSWTEGNSAEMAAEGLEFTVEKNEDVYTFNNGDRYLSLNSARGSDYFAMYASQTKDLYLIPAVEGEEAQPTVESIKVEGYTTTFTQGDEFVFGGTVTATLSNGVTEDVTELAEFSGYDMSATGTQTVTVAYEGKTATYEITINAKQDSGDASTEWVATSFADLKAGDQVVIVATKGTSTYALANDNGTSAAPEAVTGITYSNNKLTAEPAARIIWYVGVSGNDRIFYADAGQTKWLYCTNANNGIRVGDTNSAKTFAWESDYMKHNGTSRYVGVYVDNPDWRCYTNTTGNIAGQTFLFFVKKDGSSGGETPSLSSRNLAFSAATATATVGEAFTAPVLSGVTDGVTYSSSNTAVATVDESTGAVTIVAAGTTTITASAPATAEYKAGEASYTLTVSVAQGGAKMWKLVTDASSLQAGDKLAIVSTSKGKIASATISESIMGVLNVTITNNSFATLPSGAAELTLGGSAGAWTLTNASGKKLGATAVKKVAWGSGTTTWTITIASNGDATIQSTTSSYGRFLHNVGSPRFTTYTSNASSSMLLPQIYRYE